MVNENKANVFAAVAGVVVGAGAVIASVVAMKDKGNQKKVQDLISTAKDKAEEGKENIKKMAGKAINKAERVTKSAKKEVKKI